MAHMGFVIWYGLFNHSPMGSKLKIHISPCPTVTVILGSRVETVHWSAENDIVTFQSDHHFFLFQSGNFRIFKFQNAQRSADYCFEFGYFILVHFEPDFNHLSCMFQKSHFRATNHNQSPKCKCGTTGNKPRIRCWTIREIVSLSSVKKIDTIFISGPYQCRILYIIMPFTTRTQGKILSPPKCGWANSDD